MLYSSAQPSLPHIPSSAPRRTVSSDFLAENYLSVFDAILADTGALREKALRLRYEVYCVEKTDFENPNEHPDGMERDSYDTHSEHGLLIHRPTGLAIGTVRAILPDKENWRESFPIQSMCQHPSLCDLDSVLASMEMSRFCISRKMRKHILHPGTYHDHADLPGERLQSAEIHDTIVRTRAVVPYLCLGLINLLFKLSVRHGRSYAYAALDPTLIALLTQSFICPERLGDDVKHHGIRTPIRFIPLEVLETTYRNKREVWKIISDNGSLHDLVLPYRETFVRRKLRGGNSNPVQRLKIDIAMPLVKRIAEESRPVETPAPLMRILDAARWTPSGDNSQPWRFEIMGENAVRLHIFSNIKDILNINSEPTLLSIGMMLEIMAIAAGKEGKTLHWTALPTEKMQDGERYRFDLMFEDGAIIDDPLYPIIPLRHTDRRYYRATPLSASEKQALEAALGSVLTVGWRESRRECWQNAKLNMQAFTDSSISKVTITLPRGRQPLPGMHSTSSAETSGR